MSLDCRFYFQGADGVLVPGGFGGRGVQGKIVAAKYARENRVPFLGICLGMQVAVIEFTRSVLGLQDSNSTEFDPDTRNPSVIFMPEVIYPFSSLPQHVNLSFSFFLLNIYCLLINMNRDQRPTWVVQCALVLGGLTFKFQTLYLQNCMFTTCT